MGKNCYEKEKLPLQEVKRHFKYNAIFLFNKTLSKNIFYFFKK
jgi:hypothetical protein